MHKKMIVMLLIYLGVSEMKHIHVVGGGIALTIDSSLLGMSSLQASTGIRKFNKGC